MYNGIAIDTRTDEAKTRDFYLDEVASGESVTWQEREPVAYTPRDQSNSGSCVAQTAAKMLEVWDFKNDNGLTVYSATPIFQARSNRPQSGMIGVDALNFSIKNGTYLEKDTPSQKMTDLQIDSREIKGEKQPVKPTNFGLLNRTFENIAENIKRNFAVMVWFRASELEWCKDIPSGYSNSDEVRHSVTAIDYITYKGTKYIIVDDSWGKWNEKSGVPLKERQRAITQEFFEKHCYYAAAFTQFVYDGGINPKFVFTKTLKHGDSGEDVRKLQDYLKSVKLFPSNQKSSGYFGSITSRAVQRFQVSHGVTDFANERDMTKIRIGAKTLKILNS